MILPAIIYCSISVFIVLLIPFISLIYFTYDLELLINEDSDSDVKDKLCLLS